MIGHSVGAYMRMYILSDPHLEFKPFIPQISEDIDLVILVGDIWVTLMW